MRTAGGGGAATARQGSRLLHASWIGHVEQHAALAAHVLHLRKRLARHAVCRPLVLVSDAIIGARKADVTILAPTSAPAIADNCRMVETHVTVQGGG